MKKFLVFLFFVLTAVTAFAVGENIPTSKSYVDSAAAQKQDKIPANNGAEQILMNTGTPGNVGTKDIYDSTGSYIEQTDALVTAEQFNTAVQNAIDSEFECVGWDQTHTHCWFVKIRGVTEQTVLPTGYTALEYLESTGTQYIDTEIAKSSNVFKVEVDVSFSDSTGRYLIGTGSDSPNYCGRAGDGKFELNYFDRTTFQSGTNERVKMEYFGTGSRIKLTVTKNGISETLTGSGGGTTTTRTFIIFASNSDAIKYILNGKIYLAKIFINNELKRDLLPARRDRDGELGMYDLVSNTFFTNAGTGEFIAGPDANNIYLPSGN